MNLKELEAAVEALREQVGAMAGDLAELRESVANGKPKGPKSDRPMKDGDAYRVKFGDLNPKNKNHKEAAEILGLSYGQVFSARGGYTFKHVKAGMFNDDGTAKPKVENGRTS